MIRLSVGLMATLLFAAHAADAHAQDTAISSTLVAQLQRTGADAPMMFALAGPAHTELAPKADRRDGKLRVVVASYVAAAVADTAISMYQIEQGVARERGFGAPWQDSQVAFALTKGALIAVFAYQITKVHEKRPKTAYVMGLVGTAVETALAVRSARIGGPAVRK